MKLHVSKTRRRGGGDTTLGRSARHKITKNNENKTLEQCTSFFLRWRDPLHSDLSFLQSEWVFFFPHIGFSVCRFIELPVCTLIWINKKGQKKLHDQKKKGEGGG